MIKEAPTGIGAVIERLEAIVADGQAQRDPSGYFAALYLAVTQRVEAGVESGRFHDGERPVRIDVAFAERHFDALDAWRATDDRPTRTGSIAVGALEDARSTHA